MINDWLRKIPHAQKTLLTGLGLIWLCLLGWYGYLLASGFEPSWSEEGFYLYNAWISYQPWLNYGHTLPLHTNYGILSGLPYLVFKNTSILQLRLFSLLCGLVSYSLLAWVLCRHFPSRWLLLFAIGGYFFAHPLMIHDHHGWPFIILNLALAFYFFFQAWCQGKHGLWVGFILALCLSISVIGYTPAGLLVTACVAWLLWKHRNGWFWAGIFSGLQAGVSFIHRLTPITFTSLFKNIGDYRNINNVPVLQLHFDSRQISELIPAKTLVVKSSLLNTKQLTSDFHQVNSTLHQLLPFYSDTWLDKEFTRIEGFVQLADYIAHQLASDILSIFAAISLGGFLGLVWVYLQSKTSKNTLSQTLFLILCAFLSFTASYLQPYWYVHYVIPLITLYGLLVTSHLSGWSLKQLSQIVMVACSALWTASFILDASNHLRFYPVIVALTASSIYGYCLLSQFWSDLPNIWKNWGWQGLVYGLLSAWLLFVTQIICHILGLSTLIPSDMFAFGGFNPDSPTWLCLGAVGFLGVLAYRFKTLIPTSWWLALVVIGLMSLIEALFGGIYPKINYYRYFSALAFILCWVGIARYFYTDQAVQSSQNRFASRWAIRTVHLFFALMLLTGGFQKLVTFYHGQGVLETLFMPTVHDSVVPEINGLRLSPSRKDQFENMVSTYKSLQCNRNALVTVNSLPMAYFLTHHQATIVNTYMGISPKELKQSAVFSDTLCVLDATNHFANKFESIIPAFTARTEWQTIDLGQGLRLYYFKP